MSQPINALDFANIAKSIIVGDIDSVQLFLNKNPNLVFENEFGETLLHLAADNSQYDIVKLLLSLKACPNTQNSIGESPLHVSIFRSDSKIAKLLLFKGANPNLQNNNKETCLHYAVQYKEVGLISTLLHYGADSSIKNIHGLSAWDVLGSAYQLNPLSYTVSVVAETTTKEDLQTLNNESPCDYE